MVTVFLLQASMGIIGGFAIEDIEKMITLNWRDYSAGEDPDDRENWCYLLAYTVVLLPAVDMVTSFPIVSSNLCDNILSYKYGHDMAKDIDNVRIT